MTLGHIPSEWESLIIYSRATSWHGGLAVGGEVADVKYSGCQSFIRMRKRFWSVGVILAMGFMIRLALSPFFADYSDFSYWAGIAMDVMGNDGIYRDYDLWYPPVWGYVVALVTPMLELFGIAPMEVVIDEASQHGYMVGFGWIVSPLAVMMIKLPLIICDVASGYVIYRIAARSADDERTALIPCAFWMFCPLSIYVTAVQGQFESVEILLVLLAVWAFLRRSYFESGAFIAASVLTKPFTALAVIPIMALIWVNGRDRRVLDVSRYAIGGIAMTAFLILPLIINGELDYMLGFMSGRYGLPYPLPDDYSMTSLAMANAISLSPSGSNFNSFFPLSMLVSLIISGYVLAKGRVSEKTSVLFIAAAVGCHLMWFPATGYVQYYVPVAAMMCVAYAYDRRYTSLIILVTAFALFPALWGFSHAYQLSLLDWVSPDALNGFYQTLRELVSIQDALSTCLKFLPILISVVLPFMIARGEADG